MKDWEYYKKEYLEEQHDNSLRWFKMIEKRIKSPIERIAFMHLIYVSNHFGEGEVHITPQYKIGKYTADFHVYHQDVLPGIIVECDGHDFHEKTKEQAAHDKKRDRFFAKNGYTVLRYTGTQICNDPMEIFNDVMELLEREHERNGAV